MLRRSNTESEGRNKVRHSIAAVLWVLGRYAACVGKGLEDCEGIWDGSTSVYAGGGDDGLGEEEFVVVIVYAFPAAIVDAADAVVSLENVDLSCDNTPPAQKCLQMALID
ncbi:hypothetical protein NM688_g4323 [Phlebia brevispora]|uniref:Uncharacterized protein n=1 Tax=Phlebia brevispora TaxID=194682 RepID=A0ACC1T2Y6_9APHY|nr:hypothetical protein NM688_g4323 [Phlebia brevispora]